jgi:hypothetical protein
MKRKFAEHEKACEFVEHCHIQTLPNEIFAIIGSFFGPTMKDIPNLSYVSKIFHVIILDN